MSPRVSSPAVAVVLALAILLVAPAAHADTTVCTIQAPSSFSGSQQFGSCTIDIGSGDTYYASFSGDSVSTSFTLQAVVSVSGTTIYSETITVPSCSSSSTCTARIPTSGCSQSSPISGSGTITLTGLSSSTVSISNGQGQLIQCGGGGGGTGCFANGQTVTLSSGTSVPIEQVREGDRVLASLPSDPSKLHFSPVTWIMEHRVPKPVLRITVKHNAAQEEQVVVTPNHLMVVQGKGTIQAADVKLGDTMWISSGGVEASRPGTVSAIKAEQQPQHVRLVLTKSGTIVVNNVVASSLESSGSSVVKQLLDIGEAVGGSAGVQAARSLTYAVGSMVTGGDAQQSSSMAASA